MNRRELENILINNRNCNFIAYGNTVLHACGIDAVVKYLSDKGIELNGYILIGEHGVTGRLLSKDNFVTQSEKIKILDINTYEYKDLIGLKKRIKLLFQKSLHTDKKIFLVKPVLDPDWHVFVQSIFPNEKLVHIIIDDGGATYENPMVNAAQYMPLNETNDLKQKLRHPYLKLKLLYRVYYLEFWKRHLEKNNEYICGTIYKKNVDQKTGDAEFEKNELFSKWYREVFEDVSLDISDNIIEPFEDSIIINTQCFEENKLTDGIVDFKVIDSFIKCLEGINIPVVLKPHPREIHPEKYESLGCNVIYEKVSQEKIIAKTKIKPKCIVSFYSSMLFNAYGLFDIPAISLARILLKEEISEVLKAELIEFYKNYKSVIYFPEDYDELNRLLREMLR